GLLAKAARKAGLTTKPWVKTSLAPGSQVVSDYLAKARLDKELEALGFHLVGYGCTSCIGNSGPLPPPISDAIHKADMTMAAVLSGNRNFEGRISPDVRANYLASPMLVVAYALAGTMRKDLTREPLGQDKQGRDVYLKDIWPDSKQIADLVRQTVTADMFRTRYAAVFEGDARWRAIDSRGGATYAWRSDSSYIQRPPFFEDIQPEPAPLTPIADAHILALLGDSITTDHISPAGNIQAESPAGQWLQARQIAPPAFNSYGSRRGHHEVMMRGTFANIRIRNQMTPDLEGGWTRVYPGGERMTIYDAAMHYRARQVPLVVFAGREYGTGSSRDWAAKGTRLLGVRAVIAESFERIHRSNLIGMGVLPLQFLDGASWQKLGLKGDEQVSLSGVTDALTARQEVDASVRRADGSAQTLRLLCRIDTQDELAYYRHGGILPYVLRQLAA
ncbi:MAG: aconitate hydratase AcnA, partial [Hyphomicrobiales bacterium]|nr:aconitate hydratase AcnA [Hyphomicrobiales bacterium]